MERFRYSLHPCTTKWAGECWAVWDDLGLTYDPVTIRQSRKVAEAIVNALNLPDGKDDENAN